MNLENTMLSRRSQTQRTTYCIIPFIWNIQNKQIHRDWKYNSGCLELQGNRWMKVMLKGCGSGVFEVMKIFWNRLRLWLHNSDYTKNYWIIHFKWVICLVCELYLNKIKKKEIKGLLDTWEGLKWIYRSDPIPPWSGDDSHRCQPYTRRTLNPWFLCWNPGCSPAFSHLPRACPGPACPSRPGLEPKVSPSLPMASSCSWLALLPLACCFLPQLPLLRSWLSASHLRF